MERRHFSKSTPQQVEKIREYYNKGWNISSIAKIVHRDRSSLYYWLNHLTDFPETKGIKQQGIRQRIKIEKKIKVEKPKPEVKLKDPLKCQNCQKEKEWKFKLTNWCSKDCWDAMHQLRKKLNYWEKYILRLEN